MAGEKMISASISLQPRIWERLQGIIATGRVGSAYLFSGPSGCGKEGIAIAFSAGLNCERKPQDPCGECGSCKRFRTLQHEHLAFIVPLPGSASTVAGGKGQLKKDRENVGLFQAAIQEKATNPFFKIVFPKAKQILISSIRDLRKTLYLKSHIQGRKTVLIFDSHLLSIGQGAAGNALLKILEEPPNNTTLILVTDYKEQLLPTLSSRCQQVDFPPLDPEVMTLYLEKMGISSELVPIVTEISQGNMHRAYSLLDKSTEDILVMIKDMVVSIFTEDGSSWKQFINEYSQLALNDPQEFIFKFHLLQLWLRNAYRGKLGLSSNVSLVGLDEGSLSFVQKLREIDFLRIDTYLEEILTGMTRNLNTSIALTNLLIKLHREMNEGRLYG